MSSLLSKLKPIFWTLLLLSIAFLFAGLYFIYQGQQTIKKELDDLQGQRVGNGLAEHITSDDTCGQDCQDEIAKTVSEAISTISATTEKVVEKQTVVTQAEGTDYIPMGAGTTTSTSWVDVDDSAVYIDLESDYGTDATVSWETSLKVAHGNGKAFARLYDDTNKIAVDFSELSTENNADFTQVSTGNLPFWKGRNLYKVQIKSLNSFEVTYSGGKIKVSY